MQTSGYLLDTNALSATRHPKVNSLVADFLQPLDTSTVFVSVMTLGELRKGLFIKSKKAPNGVAALAHWVERIDQLYAGRVLMVDAEIAKLWGELSSGRSRDVVDTLIAATAIVHNLTVVTRNVADFQGFPVRLHNPWDA